MSQVTVEQALQIALQHHQAGRFGEAEAIYRQVLAHDPHHPDALHLLGALASHFDRHDMAVELISKAVACGLNTPEVHNNLANALRFHGAIDSAITAAQKAITLRAAFPEAHCNLGNALFAAGRFEESITSSRRAIALKPDLFQPYGNLGNVLRAIGDLSGAVAAFRQAIALNPAFAEGHIALGDALRARGEPDAAIAAYRQAIAVRPDFPEAYNNLGNPLRETGRIDEAIAACRRAIALRPDYSEAHSNLGNALYDKGELDVAIASYRQAVVLNPNHAEALSNLGNALCVKGDLEGAIIACQEAIRIKPQVPDAHNNLGTAFFEKGDLDQAIAACRQAIALRPAYPEAHSNLANALRGKRELDEAIVSYRHAIALAPNFPAAYSNLANALKDTGELDASIECSRKAVALQPSLSDAHSNLLLGLHYHADSTSRSVLAESEAWARQHAEPLRHLIQPHANDRNPDRRLRIGYVSPDLWEHVVGRALLPFLAACDTDQVESVCYNNGFTFDETTRRLRAEADHWRDTVQLSRDALTQLIRQDRIDILVDLSAHSSHHRLLTFACKPAPVQVTWLGFPATTGLRTMDYRITDVCLDPPDSTGERDALYTERSIRLPDGAFCFQPPANTPGVNPLPALKTGRVTFGCLNNLCKVTAKTFEAWIEILRATPSSDLLLYAVAGNTRRRIEGRLAAAGIAPSRVRFVGLGGAQYFHIYHEIDISLDPFPFTGSTTTCDSLWMGVPVITLTGPRIVSRLSLTILSSLGLMEWVADDVQRYIQIATELAGDLPRLAQFRGTLRERMKASSLMDAPRFAGNMLSAYRAIWRRWCEGAT